MSRNEIVRIIEERKLIAVVRAEDPDDLYPIAEALYNGGVTLIELTMTIPGVLDMIQKVRQHMNGKIIVGLGSILTAGIAKKAVQAGARFIVSPIMRPEIIRVAHQGDAPAAIGAYSPTEIQEAWDQGADIVKVFPASRLGPSYIKAVKAPLPHLRLMPTGGVSHENVHDWLAAGSFGLGVGGALVDMKAIRAEKFDVLSENARLLTEKVNSYKGAG